jgi:methionyl-tRNA formyltransferase
MKKILFIGNRYPVYEQLLKLDSLKIIETLALNGSFLHQKLESLDKTYTLFTEADKEYITKKILDTDFDLLISNGCPVILPVSLKRQSHQIFVNIHPSYLPHLRGLHPVNGVFLMNYKYAGATMHYIEDGIDNGNIIYQEKFDITESLDLGLLYHMLFSLEARVFSVGMQLLMKTNFKYEGTKQLGFRSYYDRNEKDMNIDFTAMSDEEILTRIRTFGIESQGVSCKIDNSKYKVFDAEMVVNNYLLNMYAGCSSGILLLEYEGKLLVKTRDGIMKIKSYQKL